MNINTLIIRWILTRYILITSCNTTMNINTFSDHYSLIKTSLATCTSRLSYLFLIHHIVPSYLIHFCKFLLTSPICCVPSRITLSDCSISARCFPFSGLLICIPHSLWVGFVPAAILSFYLTFVFYLCFVALLYVRAAVPTSPGAVMPPAIKSTVASATGGAHDT